MILIEISIKFQLKLNWTFIKISKNKLGVNEISICNYTLTVEIQKAMYKPIANLARTQGILKNTVNR